MQIEPGKLDRLGHNLKFRALVWVTVSWFLLAAGFLQNVYADSPTLYAGEGGDGGSLIMVLNPATGAAISAVDLQQSLTGLALHPTTRVLYGSIASANSGTIPGNTLVTVNPDTLVVTTIGPFNIGAPLPDLAFDPATNILYGWSGGSGGTGDLHTVNLVTGAATKVAESGLSFGNGPGLAFANGNLYLAGNGDCGVLHTINAATGLSTASVQLSGDIEPCWGINAMAFDGSTLFGSNRNGELLTINPSTGTVTILGQPMFMGSPTGMDSIEFDSHAELTLLNNVTNDDTGSAPDTAWTLSAIGVTPGLASISGAEGDAAITAAQVGAGVFQLDASSGPSGYLQGDWSCTGGNLAGNMLTLALGETASCTIVHDDIPAFDIDLGITKISSANPVAPGQVFTYTVTVTNAGPGYATNVHVQDAVPAGLINVSWDCQPAGSAVCNASGIGGIDELVDLPAGNSVVFTVSAEVVANPPPTIDNTAFLDYPRHRILVAELGNGRVQTCGYGGVCTEFGVYNGAGSVFVDRFDRTVISDITTGRINLCEFTGSCTFFGSNGSGLGQFSNAHYIADDRAGGRIIVGDQINNRIQVCSDVGVCTAFGTVGSLDGEFINPSGVAINSSGEIIVADRNNNRIQVCSDVGVCSVLLGTGTGLGQVNQPNGVAVDSFDRIIISDSGNDRIQICNRSGICSAFGSTGINPGEFDEPQGVAVNLFGEIVISDRLNDRIQVCNYDGSVCNAFGGTGAALGQFNIPWGLDAPRNGRNDTNGGNNLVSLNLAVVADVAVTKTTNVSEYLPGGPTINYTIAIVNNGPGDATNVSVVDDIPSGIISASWTCTPSAGANCNASGFGSIDEIVDLPSGESVTYEYLADPDSGATGNITNTVTIDAGAVDTNAANDTSSVTITEGVPQATTINVSPGLATTIELDGLCSLAEAFLAADDPAAPTGPGECPVGDGVGPVTINLAPGSTYTFDSAVYDCCGESPAFLPSVQVPLTLNGNGATIEAGAAAGSAVLYGAVNNFSVNNVTFTGIQNNPVIDFDASNGLLTVSQVTFDNSFGGIYLFAGTADIDESLFVGRGPVEGYGVSLTQGGIVTITNSTISNTNNGISSFGSVTIENSTFSGNEIAINSKRPQPQRQQAENDLAHNTGRQTRQLIQREVLPGILPPGSLEIANSIVANSQEVNCLTSFGATINSNDFNIDDDSTCGFSQTNDQSSVDPLLGLLTNNGGPTRTFAPLPGSPAIDAMNLGNLTCPAVDQRGVARPQDGNGLFGTECDIGAVEIELTDIDLAIEKGSETPAYLPGGSVLYFLFVTNNGPSAVTGALVADTFPAGLANITWDCFAGPGANCNATGTGNISELVDIPAGSFVDFQIIADILPATTGDLSNTATVSNSSGLTETIPADNTSTLVIPQAIPVVIDVDPGVVDIDYEDGMCSLIEAFDAVDGAQAPDLPGECPLGDGVASATINLAPGSTYTLVTANFLCCAENQLFLPQLFVPTTVNGNGATIATGVDPDSAVFMSSDSDLNINDLTIQGGIFEPAIYYNGFDSTLTLTRVALLDNFGGVRLRDGSGVIDQSLIDGRTEEGYGVRVAFDTNLAIINSTITDTDSGINNFGTTNLINSTVNGTVFGIETFDGTVTVQNSIIASSLNANCLFGESGTIDSADFNISDDASCSFNGNNDLNSTNPLLGPLGDNGGPTQSFHPLPGSPAIDALNPGNPSCPAIDQRGIARPQDGNADLTATCDIGSVEVQLTDIDLAITKTASVASAFPGDMVNFTLTVVNNGPAAAAAAQVVDNLAGIGLDVPQSWTCTPSQGATCSPFLNGSIDDLVQIPAGGSLVYVLTAPVSSALALPFTINNSASVTADAGLVETNPGNNNDSASILAFSPDTFDLQIGKTDGLATASPGEVITYTITVTNAGTTTIVGASVDDVLPTQLENVSWTCSASAGGSCAAAGTGDISELLTIVSTGTVVFTVTATVDELYTGPLMNTATVTMPLEFDDEFPDNNSATDATEVVAMADLSVVKTTSAQFALTDVPVEFQVTVTNNGPEPATQTVLDDVWTSELTLIDVQPAEIDCGAETPSSQLTAAGGSVKLPKPRPYASAANTLQCNLGNLAAGASIVLTMIFEVSGETGAIASNSAVVSSAIPDPSDGNNGSTATIEIVQVLELTPVETQLPAATEEQPYTQAFEVTGGVEPISIDVLGDIDGLTWSIVGRTATLSGTPARAGIHAISVDVQDSLTIPGPQSIMRDYVLQVAADLVIDPETLPPGTLGAPYTAVLESLNGVPPFTFNVDTLPSGLSFNGDTIEGVPQADGTFPVVVDATDSQGNTGVHDYDLVINLTPMLEQVLPDGVLETGYSAQLFAPTANGPLIWTVDSGLPPGLTLQPTGFIGGLPEQEGSFAFNATATDTQNNQSTGQLNIRIGATGLLAQESRYPNGAVGFRYSAPTGIDGGVPPYSCAPGSGGLPPGLILNGCNIGIDGIPGSPGTFRFTLAITDSSQEVNNLSVSGRIQIVAGPQIPDPDPPDITLPNPKDIRVIETGSPVPPEFPPQFPDEALQKLAIDGFGNRYTAGFSYNGTDYDIRILKYNSRGEVIWDQRYDSGDHDYGYAVTVNPVDQSLYVGGYQLDGTEYKAVLLRFDLAGILQYVAQNPGGSQAKGYYDLAANADGVFAVGEAYNGTNFDGIVAFHAHDGTLMWETTRAASDTESAYAIELNACEGCPVVVAGVSGVDRGNGWVDALDPVTGTLSSLATVSGFGVLDIAPGNDGIVIGGSTTSDDWTIATLDAGGAELWRTSVPAGDRLRSVATDRNGFIHAVGNGPGASGTDALIALLSPAGALLGSQGFDAGASEELNAVAIGPEGLVTAAGQSRQPAANNNTFLLLNFDTGKSFLLGPVQ